MKIYVEFYFLNTYLILINVMINVDIKKFISIYLIQVLKVYNDKNLNL